MTEPETDPSPETPAAEAPVAAAPTAVAPAPAAAAPTPAPAAAATPAPLPKLPDAEIWSVGRRKSATARIRLTAGDGKVRVNGKTLDAFFSDPRERRTAVSALEALRSEKRYDVQANVNGGGLVGQSGAIALGIARALIRCDASVVPALRAAGLLTRDARVKERKKYGRRGARRGFQFSKR